ncbi:MAG TPA: hypothetical protein VGZ02_05525 [Candidatus Baltobacteraceae bacterium]|nr:hypothetical protein [Candidatus Baltobacteraceae bacterium]
MEGTSSRGFVVWVAGIAIPVAFVVALLPLTWGYAGMAYTPGAGTTAPIFFVDSHGPAYAAGIRPGDRVIPTTGVMVIYDTAGPAGTRIPYRIVRNGRIETIPVTFVPFFGTLATQEQFNKVLGALTALAACIVGILVALRAREREAGARAAGFLVLSGLTALAKSVALVCGNAWIGFAMNDVMPPILSAAALWAALSLLSIYPPYRTRLRNALVLVGPLAVAFAIAGDVVASSAVWTSTLVPVLAAMFGLRGQNAQNVFDLALVVQIIAAMGVAKGPYRAPMRWLGGMWLAGTAIHALPRIAYLAGSTLLFSHYGDALQSVSVACFAFGVAYPVMRHRLVDLNILISRASVYAIVSAIIVGLFIAGEWALGKIFEHSLGFSSDRGGLAAQIISLGLVLVLGISARSIHRFVEDRLTNTFFRRRMNGLASIERLAHEADAATELRAYTDLAVTKVEHALETAGAAFYFRDGERYIRSSHTGTHAFIPVYGFNDEAPLALRRWHRPFEHEDASEAGHHLLFLPMSVRGDLLGFLCCGGKTDRTAFLSDEIAALALLADRTGIASALLTRVAFTALPAGVMG